MPIGLCASYDLRHGRYRNLTFSANQHSSCSSLPLVDIGRSWPALSRRIFPLRLARGVSGWSLLIRSGCFGAGFCEGEPLVAEVGDDLQAAAEGFDVGGQGA